MMAYDSRSTPPSEPRRLGEDTVAALRCAVVRLWDHPADGDAALDQAMARTIEEARARALRAEDLVVAFKDLLTRLPELDAAPERRLDAVRFRERLITRCIKAYYAAERR